MGDKNIPVADFAVIGGSSTFSLDFPADLQHPEVEILERDLVFSTPFGESPSFILFRLKGDNRMVLTCKMHGWRPGVSRADASRQVFWVLQQAGVKKILSEGGVGALNHLLKPRDLLVPHDYIDFSMRKDVSLTSEYLLIMRESVCPEIRKKYVRAAEKFARGRVFDRGIYVVTDGRHFESPSEVSFFRQIQGDIVGQSMCPEVYLAREIGACYGRIDMVVNYAEGVVEDWKHEELKQIFYEEATTIAEIILECLQKVELNSSCNCQNLRKETLLKENRGREEV
ncbi:MTAP family purine nucleoside phosphorylase [Calderihabitans maritimus]|uniref:Purine or other phosphorylase family 1 n=1 Tax=Calderihabitans maritimus TaxID=1246530 RepID=A0A1Z5HQC5_9FIRM|nr:MTAP family purine nucleoside phosphorylase [Calderihabitans maritimus]GAW91505.1 purine or other phosphorylase family 1 [Calderihabitans maritimus]